MTGTYRYTTANWNSPRRSDGRPYINNHTCRVEILEVTSATVLIKLLEFHVDGRGPGTVMRVKRSKVCIDGTAQIKPNNQSAAVRLPYKDE